MLLDKRIILESKTYLINHIIRQTSSWNLEVNGTKIKDLLKFIISLDLSFMTKGKKYHSLMNYTFIFPRT